MATNIEQKEAEQSRGRRGDGSIYKQKYRTRDGKLHESRFWSIKYYKHGFAFRENTRSEKWPLQSVCYENGLGKLTPACSCLLEPSDCITRI